MRVEQIYSCGPKPMMVAVAKYAKSNQIECEVSLENIMACGIGACLCCVENTTAVSYTHLDVYKRQRNG